MPIINRMAELHDDITSWRRDFHANPELMYDVQETAQSVAQKLAAFGCDEVVEGIGRTGVVGVIRGKRSGAGGVIGLRADMDALPIEETTGKPHASRNPGKMHACGHDGHTAMLLGAARYLCETRNFSGTAIVIFQPAEEGGAGGKAMVDDGLMDRFAIQEVYGLHNMPGLPVGEFAIRAGGIMASTDEFDITITGKGSHAAMPHLAIDPIVIAAQCVMALQSIVSRGADPIDSLVVSVTQLKSGFTHNVIPGSAYLNGTVRSLKPEMRDFAEKRIREIVGGIAAANGATIEIQYERSYPVTYNHAEQTRKAAAVAESVAGKGRVDDQCQPMLGGEDFSYMLEARPGAFIFMGNGDTASLHNPDYDFNDDAIPVGASYWARLVETLLPGR
ncbi:MAG: M20 aminoacylase family protein [Rhizobiaceae bacterium]